MGPVAQPVFKTGAAWQPHARSVRLRRRSVNTKPACRRRFGTRVRDAFAEWPYRMKPLRTAAFWPALAHNWPAASRFVASHLRQPGRRIGPFEKGVELLQRLVLVALEQLRVAVERDRDPRVPQVARHLLRRDPCLDQQRG